MNGPIVFGRAAEPGEIEISNAAKAAVKAAMLPLVEQHCPVALLNALLTVYVEMGLGIVGFEIMDNSFRIVRRELPRIAAVVQANLNEPKGRA